MGQFSNGNANALGVWQSHDGRCDGDGGGLAIAPKTGDAILFYNPHVGADGRLGDSAFDFMKEELTVKDAVDITTKVKTQPYAPPPVAVTGASTFPVDGA